MVPTRPPPPISVAPRDRPEGEEAGQEADLARGDEVRDGGDARGPPARKVAKQGVTM